MPAYHSSFNEDTSVKTVCNMAILPIKTKFKGPAPVFKGTGDDIIDETLNFFKANVLFRNYEVKGAADRTLLYLTLYASQMLGKIGNVNKGAAEKAAYQLAIENFALPGDRGFVLGGFVTNPQSRAETDMMRQYFTQMRQELGYRLVQRVYAKEEGKPDKWWMCFVKRKFLNKTL